MFNAFLYTYVYYGSSGKSFFGSIWFYVVMSLLLIGTGGWLLYTKAYRYTKLKKSCTVPVDARLLQVDSRFGGRGGKYWNVTYEFFYNETRFVVNNDIWEQTRWQRPVEGNVETIMINPYNPREIYDRIANAGRKTGIVAGSLLLFLSVFIMVIPFVTG